MTTLTLVQTIRFDYPKDQARCWRAAISPDGARVAASSYYEQVIHDVGDDAPRWVGERIDDPRGASVGALAWSPDSALLAMTFGGVVQLRDGATGELVRELPAPIATGSQLVWTQDARHLLLSHRLLYLIDAQTGAEVARFDGPASFQRVAFTEDESRIIAVGDKSLWIYDAASAQLLHRYPFARFGASSLATAPDGSSAWVCEAGDTLTRLHIGNKGKKVLAKSPPLKSPNVLIAHPDGARFISTSEQGVSVHSASGGDILASSGPWRWCRGDDLSISADGALVTCAHLDGSATLWRVE